MPRKFLNGIDAGTQRITSVADPSSPQDAATKSYVDSSFRGYDWKVSVRAASTGNLTLSGLQTVDGVSLVAGDRVLAKDQTTGSANGIYVVAAGAWSRAVDADSDAEVTAGLTVTSTEGTLNGDKLWRLITNDPIVLGTTTLTFTEVGGSAPTYTAGDGLTLTGQTLAVGAGTGLVVTADTVAIDTNVVARKVAANVGNGSATSIAVNHGLGTRDVHVTVFEVSSNEEVVVDVIHTDINNVTLLFATAPPSNAYRCVVVG